MTTGLTSQRPTLHRRFAFQETARILALIAVAAWLLHPFATSRQVGAGDALWYANMLADFCLQLRGGVFPVFVGQTEFAFNGAVYPLRVAPFYQHLGGLLDLLTLHRLDWFTLQHLCVIVCGVAGLFTCYFTLATLAPHRRWSAAGLAILYLSCPGVLGTIYTQDLYMTWMTVPFLPLAVYGILRPFRHDDLASQLWLAAPLAALWLAHSPVALWMTFFAAFTQITRLVWVHRHWPALRRALVGAGAFALLGSYPFISVAALQTPGVASAVMAGLEHQERITNVIREVFPALLLPLSDHAHALSDLQLGYGLWLIGGLALISAFRPRQFEVRLLLIGCSALLVLLLPVPFVTDWLWAHLPEQIKRITFYWPMHRFYLLLAALLALAAQLALGASLRRDCSEEKENRRTMPPLQSANRENAFVAVALILACAWSLWESRQFVRAGRERTASTEITQRARRPENRLLMNHAYGLFAALPAYFSNGVMDPRAEVRLLARDTLQPLPQTQGRTGLSGRFEGERDANPGILNFKPSLHLEPGRRYELTFTWASHDYQGILQLVGREFFREYALPASGEKRAFGSRPPNSPTLSLWTTRAEGDDITLRFIPTQAGADIDAFAHFASFSLCEIDPTKTEGELTSLLPFRAELRPSTPAWLETPRMFQPGYEAHVDGQSVSVQRSPAGLAMLPLTPGAQQVELVFRSTLSLRASYWTLLAAWAALVALAGTTAIRNLSAPAR